MARYKHIDTSPRLIAVDLERQLLPGTFEHALNHLIDHELDLSGFDARYRNDRTGATAWPPAMLLKVVLFAYSQGIVSSRGIERACREHITFIALSGGSAPHWTTLASFVSNLGDDIAKLEAAAQTMLARHRENDALPVERSLDAKAGQRIDRLRKEAAQLRDWLAANPEDRKGSKGSIRKSNRTDNQSAKMATGKGVIQGYTGVAAVDSRHQIIVAAQAHTGEDEDPAGGVLPGQGRPAGAECQRADAPGHRLRTGARALRQTLRDRRAGLWQPAAQRAAEPFHAARAEESGWAVEALLSGA